MLALSGVDAAERHRQHDRQRIVQPSRIFASQGCTGRRTRTSTAVYWKPIFNIMKADFEVVLGNAKHVKNVKNVPGRKTDVQDCR